MNYGELQQRVVLVMIEALEEIIQERTDQNGKYHAPASRQELKSLLKARIARKIVSGDLYRIQPEAARIAEKTLSSTLNRNPQTGATQPSPSSAPQPAKDAPWKWSRESVEAMQNAKVGSRPSRPAPSGVTPQTAAQPEPLPVGAISLPASPASEPQTQPGKAKTPRPWRDRI